MRSHILQKSAYRIFFRIYIGLIAFSKSHTWKLCRICENSHIFAHLRICDRIFQHFCAFVQRHRPLNIFCIVFVDFVPYDDGRQFTYFAKIHILHIFRFFPHNNVAYAAYMPHILPICRIFQRIFRQIPHILHQNSPHILRKMSAINRHPLILVSDAVATKTWWLTFWTTL